MLFGECRAADDVELLASYVVSGNYSALGGKSVKSVKVKAVVEGGRVLAALFNDGAVVNNRVVEAEEVLARLSPRAAMMFREL